MVGAVGPSRVAMGGVRMSRSRVRVGRWVAILAVISLFGVIGVSAAGAQQNPPVDQPGVTNYGDPRRRSRDRDGRPDRQQSRGARLRRHSGVLRLHQRVEGQGRLRPQARPLFEARRCSRQQPARDSGAARRQRVRRAAHGDVPVHGRRSARQRWGPYLRVAHQRRMGFRGRQPGTAQPVRSKRIVPQPRVSGSQLLRRRLAGPEAQQEAHRPDRVQRAPVLGIYRRRRRDLPEVPEGGEGRVQGHEPLVRRGGLQRPGLQDERREGQPGDPVPRRERRVHPRPRDEEAGPQRPDDPAERIQPGAHREERRRRQRQLRVHGLHAVREQVQARKG